MLRLGIILLAFVTVQGLTTNTGYDGFKIFDVLPKTQEQCDFLHELSKNEEFYDFFALSKLPNHLARVMVTPDEEENFLNALAQHKLAYQIVNDNVGRSLEQEFLLNKLSRSRMPFTGKGRLSTNRYYSHSEMNAYIEDLAQRFPSRVFVKKAGVSYEGRDMKTITITNGDGGYHKNVIFVDAGIHAREWISPATVLFVIEQLVENYEENKELLKDYDFIILPMANPDGYEYTRSSSSKRFWRKTRQPYEVDGKVCYGADPNRNFDFHWNEEGASDEPCSDIYAGPKGFSEPETMVIRDLLHSLQGRGIMYLTLHSYGNYLLYPWGWTYDLPATWKDLDEVARFGGDAIYNATGAKYTVGSSTNVLYIAAGGSDDYAFSTGFKIAVTMELPRGGITGFDPTPTNIDKIVKESWIGIRAMFAKAIEKYPSN